MPDYFLLTIGSIILVINFDLFLAPFNIAPGGVSGTAIIINKFTGWLPGITMLVLTLPMLILGFYYLGRFRFLIRASYTDHTTLFSAIKRPDVKILTSIVNEVDPKSFVVILQGHQTMGGRLR